MMNFECEQYFHIYTRANSEKDQLFIEDDNYDFFMKKYKKYISPVFETLCYCLIPNHYHVLVKVKSKEAIFFNQKKRHYKYFNEELRINDFLQQQFANFHISYAKAFNKLYDRRGSLFQSKPKAKLIKDLNSILKVSRYIHRNPIKHGLVSELKSWEYSSYSDYIGLRNDVTLQKHQILSQFETLKDFINFNCLENDN